MRHTLVTGAAGFIGFHTAQRLLDRGERVTGLDNLNAYYDPSLKEARLDLLKARSGFRFHQMDVADRDGVESLFRDPPDVIVHLAASAGVRHSFAHPEDYVGSNLVGFFNILDAARRHRGIPLVYASSSSVYGAHATWPSTTEQGVAHPLSFYAATKVANEAMAHAYSHSYGLPTTGVRFFTVYGPWGRPDMALFSFTKAILGDRPITVYNEGQMYRDFTYIDDIVTGVVKLTDHPATPDPSWDSTRPTAGSSSAPWRVYNIGNQSPVLLLDMIRELERALGRTAHLEFAPMPPGDVVTTYADVDPLVRDLGWRPHTPLAEGIERFVAWYRAFYEPS